MRAVFLKGQEQCVKPLCEAVQARIAQVKHIELHNNIRALLRGVM